MGGGEVSSVVKDAKSAYFGLVEKGEAMCKETSLKVFGQSFMAGCYIGFGALLAVIISASMEGLTKENPGLKTLVFAGLFPVNLVLILLSGGILYTGTAATCPAAFYEARAGICDVFRCLTLSWFGNVIGSTVFSAFTVWCFNPVDDVVRADLTGIAQHKVSLRFDQTFAKGIGCNWMVCMAVYLSGQAQDMSGKILAIYLPISCFVMIGFEHLPANAYLLTLALFTTDSTLDPDNHVTFANVLFKNWLPATLGNFVAGAMIVAGSYAYFYGKIGGNTTPGLAQHAVTSLADARSPFAHAEA